jgi:hypothetical protein
MTETATRPYKRIGGTGKSMSGSATLWEGEDHLLVAEVTGYVETYKRFFYRDIQAVVVQETRGRLFGNLILCAAGALAGWPALTYPEAVSTMLPVVAFFLLFAMVNTLMGPTCAVRLVTAVNVERLRSLQRARAARKFVARVAPRIDAAQGRIDDIDALLQNMAPEQASLPAQPSAAQGERAEESPMASLRFHRLTAACLVGLCLAILLHVLFHNAATVVAECIALVALLLSSVLALIAQRGRLILPSLRRWTLAVFAFELGLYGLAYVLMIVASMRVGKNEVTPYHRMFRELTDMSSDGLFSVFTMHIAVAAGGLVLLVTGLAVIQAASRMTNPDAPRPSAPPPPPAPPPQAPGTTPP